MRVFAAITAVTLLAGCSGQAPEQGAESADDFASRIGSGASSAEGQGTPQATAATKAAPPAGASVFALEKLGNVANVDLGPRAGGGGCTFSADGQELLMAAGSADRALPGKATVRVGGQLLLLDAAPGGYDAVRSGTVFKGEGVSVAIAPGANGQGTLTVNDAEGGQKSFNGRWVCS